MKKTCIIFILFSTLFISCLSHGEAEELYGTSYVCRDLKGKTRWHATYTITRKEGEIYTLTEKAEGIYYGFNGKVSWEGKADVEKVKDSIRALNMKKCFFDKRGKMIARQRQEFDYDDNTVTCIHEDFLKNSTITKKFRFTKDIINRLMLGLYVQKFLESGKTRRAIQVVSPEPAFYNLELRIIDTEEIEISGKKRKAYKICLDPKLGLLNFIKVFLPKAYTWHSAKPKFEWLKYEGVENNLKSPKVDIIALD